MTALALAERLPERTVGPGVRGRLLFAWALGTGVPLLGIVVVGTVRTDEDRGRDASTSPPRGSTSARSRIAVGLAATLFAARAIADPVTSVRTALERVEEGDLEAEVRVEDGSEVGLLQAGFNRMAAGLREREEIRDLFGRQVGEEVARAALSNGVALGGEEVEIAALFVDLTGSTSMALEIPPAEVVAPPQRLLRGRRRGGRAPTVASSTSSRATPRSASSAPRSTVTTAPVMRSAPPGSSSRRCPNASPSCRSGSASRPARRWPATSAPSAASSTR